MVCSPLSNYLVLLHEYSFDTANLNIHVVTDEPRHLHVLLSMKAPTGEGFWHYKRGTAVLHDVKYVFGAFAEVTQEEAGETYDHHFSIPDLVECTHVYWIFKGFKDMWASCSSTPAFKAHVLFAAPPPGPQPTPIPIEVPVEPSILRPGHRLTFWANDTWYVVMGTAASIRVYKLVAGVFVRQDQGNEPTPGIGSMTDVDCRLDSAATFLHMAMYIRDYDGATDYVTYVLFNPTTDSWGAMETVCTTSNPGALDYDVAISLDSANKPHVAYTDYHTYGLAIYYQNKVGVSWSAREEALKRNFRNFQGVSVSHDLTNDAFHVIAHDNYGWVRYNRRSSAGAWDGGGNLGTQGVNLPYHSIMCDQAIPHVGLHMSTNRCCRSYGDYPMADEVDLTLAVSQRFSIVVPPSLTPDVYIIYRRNNNRPARIYKPNGYAWSPEGDLYDEAIIAISANLNNSTVISTVCRRSLGHNALFFAFAFP